MARQSFDELWSEADRLYGQPEPQPVETPVKQNTSALQDFGTAFKIGAQKLPGAVTGLLDIPVGAVTGRPMVSEGWDEIGKVTGFRPGEWAEENAKEYSPERQQFLKEAQDTEGFWNTAGHYASNPLQSTTSFVESVPQMAAGGALGRGLGIANTALRAGAGEGAMMAGAQMSGLIEDGADTRTSALASGLTGVVGGALGVGGAALGRRMGLNDLDVLFAGGGRATREAAQEGAERTWQQSMGDLVRRVVGGGAVEGVLEELPQSAMEQMLANYAKGLPIMEGVAEAAGAGAVIGSIAGGAFNVMGGRAAPQQEQTIPGARPTVDLTSALHAATNESVADTVNRTTGVPTDTLSEKQQARQRTEYEKQLEAAMEEPSGRRITDENGLERELTNFEYYHYQATGELPPPPKVTEATPPAEKTPFDTAVEAAIAANPAVGKYAKSSKTRMAKLREEIENAQSIEDLQDLANSKNSAPRSAIIEAYVEQLTRQQASQPTNATENVAPTPGAQNGRTETQPVRQEGQGAVPAQGNAPQGNAPQGNASQGNASQGNATQGRPVGQAQPVRQEGQVEGARPVVNLTGATENVAQEVPQRPAPNASEEERAAYTTSVRTYLSNAITNAGKDAATALKAVFENYKQNVQIADVVTNAREGLIDQFVQQNGRQPNKGDLLKIDNEVNKLYRRMTENGDDQITSSLRVAARELGVSHETVRKHMNAGLKAVNEAAQRMGIDNELALDLLGLQQQGVLDYVSSVSEAEAAQMGLRFRSSGLRTSRNAAESDDFDDTYGMERTEGVGETVDSSTGEVAVEENAALVDDGVRIGENEATDTETVADEAINFDELEGATAGYEQELIGADIRPSQTGLTVADAAQEWDDLRRTRKGGGVDPAWGELTKESQTRWINAYFRYDEAVLSDQQLESVRGSIANEPVRKRAEDAQGNGSATRATGSEVPRRGASDSNQQDIAVRPAERPAVAEDQGTDRAERAEAEDAAEDDLTAESIEQQWNEIARQFNVLSWDDLDASQRNELLGAAEQAEFDQIATELVGEMVSIADDVGGVQYSESADTQGSDADAIRANLRKLFLNASRFDSLVNVVQDPSELPADARGAYSSAKGRVQGFVMNRKVYLIADNIAEGRELSVMLHEIGVHLGLKNLIGAANFAKLVQQVRDWSKTTGTLESRLATKAMLRAVKSSSQTDEEVVAYFVEEAVNAGVNPSAVTQGSTGFRQWMRTVLAAVKTALRKLGWKRYDTLTAQNLVDLAYGAANIELRGTWHGTAADFRRFDHDFMNTGEGAQAFGWGTYLAQRYGIAKGYFEADVARKEPDLDTVDLSTMPYLQSILSGDLVIGATGQKVVIPADARVTQHGRGAAPPSVEVNVIQKDGSDHYVSVRLGSIRKNGAEAGLGLRNDVDFNRVKGEFEAAQASIKKPEGSMMRVVPLVDDNEMLDWDKPLSEQSDVVRSALLNSDLDDGFIVDRFASGKRYLGAVSDGRSVYNALTGLKGSDKAASGYLDSIGIKGIKFLDAQSRTRNGRNTPVSFPQYAELSKVLHENDLLGFDTRSEALDVVLMDGMVEMRRNFDLPPELDTLLTAYEQWMKAPPADVTRNIVIFNDRNIERVATRVANDEDRVKFSEVDQTISAQALSRLPGATKPTVKKALTTIREAYRTSAEWLMFTEDLVRQAHEAFGGGDSNPVTRWYNALMRREQTRNAHRAKVDEIAVGFDGLDKAQFKRTWNAIQKMTASGKWGYQPTWKPAVQIDTEMAELYGKLTAEERALLDSVFKHGDETFERVQKILNDTLEGERADALRAAKNDADRAKIEKRFAQYRKVFGRKLTKLEGPYAPMQRVGSHVVVAKSLAYKAASEEQKLEMRADPKHYFVKFMDSQTQADALADDLRAKGLYEVVDASVKEKVSQNEMLPFEAFQQIRTLIARKGEAETSATAQKLSNLVTELYLTTLAETSARKHEMRRNNVAGMDVELDDMAMYRAFLSKGSADAHYIGTLSDGRTVAESFAQMRIAANSEKPGRHERRRLFNELATRYENTLKFEDGTVIGKMLNFGSIWMLLTKPAYFLYNATQPLMLTQPALAQTHGYTASANAMWTAMKETASQLGFWNSLKPIDLHALPEDVRADILTLRDMGRIDITMTQDLGDRIHGASSKVGRAFQTAEHAFKAMAQKVEMNNRVVSAMAALRLARAKGMADPVAYASKIIYDTHGDYSNLNAPRIMNQTQVNRLLTQFRKFQFIQVAQLVRMTKETMKGKTLEEKWALSKALRYTLMHHAAMAGAMGLPAANIVLMLMGLGGDDDEPVVQEERIYKAIGNETLANLLMYGVPGVMGVNMSKNVGMGQTFSILPFADADISDKGGFEKIATAALGPVLGGLGPQAWRGLADLYNGDYYKGLEGLMPSGIRGAMKSLREASAGSTNSRGDTLVSPDEIDAFSTAVKILGFKTTDDTVRQLMRGAKYDYEQAFNNRTAALKKDYTEAYRDNDTAAMREARENWTQLQEYKRGLGFKPQPISALLRSPMEQRKRERNTFNGVQYNTGNRAFVSG